MRSRIAEKAGLLEGFTLEVRVGAGAYVCGEETALLDSLEGKRGQVRAKPPIPALIGLFGKPTVINNAISLATMPTILANGAAGLCRLTAWAARAGRCRCSWPGISGFGGLFETAFGIDAGRAGQRHRRR